MRTRNAETVRGVIEQDIKTAGTASNGRVNIGPRLREQRRRLNLTLEEVARLTGLTKGYISEVERNQASPSVASLLAICDALAITVGDLFAVAGSAVVRAEQRRPIKFGGTGVKDVLLSPHTRSRIQAIWSDMEPGATGGTPLYSLPADEEFVFVVEGRLTVQVHHELFELGAGDALTFDPRQPHTFWNPSPEQPARALFVLTPPPY